VSLEDRHEICLDCVNEFRVRCDLWAGKLVGYALPVAVSRDYKGRQVLVDSDIDAPHAMEQFLDFFESLIELPRVADLMREHNVRFEAQRPRR